MQDFLSIPSLAEPDADLTEEELAARAAEIKADRVAFHRTKVRTGPARFSSPTSGQARRQGHRDLARQTRKGRRAQVGAFLDQQRGLAVLRGHLQAIGVLAYATEGFEVPDTVRFASARWVLTHFGSDEIFDFGTEAAEADYLRAAVQAAYDQFTSLTGLPQSEVEYA